MGVGDPRREEIVGAIRSCQDAGTRFIMMTGDQPLTALAIARRVSLVSDDAADDGAVKCPERGDRAPHEPVMAREHWIDRGGWGVLTAAAQPWHVFNTRDRRASADRNN